MSALAHGYADGLDGPVEVQRWCPACEEFVLADLREHKCLWCEGLTVPAAAAAATERRPLMAIAVRTCKIDGCENEAATSAGQQDRQLPDESVIVPECDCLGTYEGPKIHRPGCARMAAIIRKWHGPEVEQRYLRGEFGAVE